MRMLLSRCRNWTRPLAVAVGGVLLGAPAQAQHVTGRVLDASDDAAIAGVEIRVVNSRDQQIAVVVADAEGGFSVPLPRAGHFRLSVAALGYEPVRSELFEVSGRDTVGIELRISRDPILLPSLTVLTERRTVIDRLARRGFYENQELYEKKMGTARFFTPEKIDSLRNPPLSRLVHGLPNYRIVSLGGRRVDIRTRQGTRPVLFIDGVLTRLREETFDDLIHPGMIGAVEVYWGANPYGGIGPVINVWTRTW